MTWADLIFVTSFQRCHKKWGLEKLTSVHVANDEQCFPLSAATQLQQLYSADEVTMLLARDNINNNISTHAARAHSLFVVVGTCTC